MARPLRLFFARHGQTEGSRAGRFIGALDVELDPQGQAMAEALALYYGDHPWAGLYASPLRRTRETAAPLALRTGLAPNLDPGLREIAYGEWEGKLEEEVRALSPAAFDAWQADPGRVAPPGGESGFEIGVRAMAAVDRIRAQHPEGGDVLAFSHKATIRILTCQLLGLDVSLFRARVAQPAGSVTAFEFRPTGPLLLCLADVRHLPRALITES